MCCMGFFNPINVRHYNQTGTILGYLLKKKVTTLSKAHYFPNHINQLRKQAPFEDDLKNIKSPKYLQFTLL